eukprot:TRINITY_DN21835_c0_g1_i1.p1 TRINITY_DN21835_c0_g1~~TRINITY_DN21835_c0_g1_i1.p1  ORF type:complete len:524 (+),score=89.92 TRINITY_DN21835_c0_g1_i1:72-1643(+)
MTPLKTIIALLASVSFCSGNDFCCQGQHVKPGILKATREPWWKYHGNEARCGDRSQICDVNTCNACWSGLVPDLHQTLSEQMGYSYELVGAPPGTTTEQLFGLLRDGTVTMLPHELGLSSFTEDMQSNFSLTQPFVTYTYSALVKSEESSADMWSLFEPFTLELWLVILGGVGVFALTFWALEGDTNTPVNGAFRGIEFVFVSLLGGMEYDGVRRDGRLGRFLRIGLLFFVLIVTATYTANLASILTAKNLILHGPRNMEQLKTSTVCNFDNPLVRSDIQTHTEYVMTPDGNSAAWEATEQGRRDCISKLIDGTVGAVIANVLELKQMQKDFGVCSQVKQIPLIAFNPRYVTFMTTRNNSAFAQNLTEAIVKLQTNKLLMNMMNENYESACTTEPVSKNYQLDVENLGGLFCITGIWIAVTIICKLMAVVGKNKGMMPDSDADKKTRDDQTHEIIQKLNQILDEVSPTQKGRPLLPDRELESYTSSIPTTSKPYFESTPSYYVAASPPSGVYPRASVHPKPQT